jgi:hypothetical protein
MTRALRNSITSDPAVLLARGYTARYLGAVLGGSITPLSSDEIAKDLQHMAAYQEATNRYQQVTYAATHSNSTRGITDDTFPVRIDPEQEQRAELQRKRIQRAEAVREELEQHYVALRAHFAMTGQQLQQTTRESVKTIEFLQNTVDQTASILALQRARLQMVRDCREALLARAEHEQIKNDGSACPMLSLWIATEEELKKVLKAKRKVVTMNWSNTMEPTIPRDVPQLSSILSTLPNYCLGYAASGVFGSNQSSIMFVESSPEPYLDQFPVPESMTALHAEVEMLEKELQSEMNRNERLLDGSAKARKSHDEWVAMISLVRQETEAVLHRHNVLLESHELRDAIAAHYQATETGVPAAAARPENEGDADHDDDDDDDEDAVDDSNNTPQQGQNLVDSVPNNIQAPSPGDDANEADDEGMVAEDEDESEANGGGKRAAAGVNINSCGNNNNEEEPRKKRRKL